MKLVLTQSPFLLFSSPSHLAILSHSSFGRKSGRAPAFSRSRELHAVSAGGARLCKEETGDCEGSRERQAKKW